MRAQTLPAGQALLTAEAAVSNFIERTPITGGWELDLDLELWRIAFAARFAPVQGLDVGVELPLLRFDAGFLDGVVDGWHDALGVPGGRRDSLPSDRFSYRVAPALVPRMDLDPVPIGLGDATVDLRLRLLDGGELAAGPRPTLALQVASKLPTGSPQAGLGSGAPDFGAWLLLEHGGQVLALHASLGLIVQGPARLLADLQVPVVLSWMAAGEVRLAPPLSLVVQVHGASPRWEGLLASNETGVSLDLAIGIAGERCGTTWQVVFVEDLIVLGPSVDFTAMASLGRRLGPPGQPPEPGCRPGR